MSQSSILNKLKSSEIARKFKGLLNNTQLFNLVTPAAVIAQCVELANVDDVLEKKRIRVLLMGELDQFAVDGGQWLSALKCLVSGNLDIDVLFAADTIKGATTPFLAEIGTFADNCSLTCQPAAMLVDSMISPDIAVISHPKTAQMTSYDIQLIQSLLKADTPIFSLHWSGYDYLNESLLLSTHLIGMNVVGNHNILKQRSPYEDGSSFAGVIGMLRSIASPKISKDEFSLLSVMRDISGYEGYANMPLLPCDKINPVNVPAPNDLIGDFIFILDNVALNTKNRWLYRCVDNTYAPFRQIPPERIKELEYSNSTEKKLTWANTIKALYFTDYKVINADGGEMRQRIIELANSKDAPNELLFMAKTVMFNAGIITNNEYIGYLVDEVNKESPIKIDCLYRLSEIYEIFPEAALIDILNKSSEHGSAVASFSLAKNAFEMQEAHQFAGDLIKKAADNYSPGAILINAVGRISGGPNKGIYEDLFTAIICGSEEAISVVKDLVITSKNKSDTPRYLRLLVK